MHTPTEQPRRRTRVARASCATLVLSIALSLAACSNVPEPKENIDSLTAVTEAPAPPAAAEEYDIELRPEPIVDPLDCTPYLVVTARGTGEPNKGQLLSLHLGRLKDAGSLTTEQVSVGKFHNVSAALSVVSI